MQCLRADVHDAPDQTTGNRSPPGGSSTHIRAVNITCTCLSNVERESGKMRHETDAAVAVVPNIINSIR